MYEIKYDLHESTKEKTFKKTKFGLSIFWSFIEHKT